MCKPFCALPTCMLQVSHALRGQRDWRHYFHYFPLTINQRENIQGIIFLISSLSPTFPLPFLILSLYFFHLSQHVLPPVPSFPTYLFQGYASHHSCMTYLILFLTPLGHLQSSPWSARTGEEFDVLKRQHIQGLAKALRWTHIRLLMEWTPWRRLKSSNKSHYYNKQE